MAGGGGGVGLVVTLRVRGWCRVLLLMIAPCLDWHWRCAGLRLRGSLSLLVPPNAMGWMWSAVGPSGWLPLTSHRMGCPQSAQGVRLASASLSMAARALRYAHPDRAILSVALLEGVPVIPPVCWLSGGYVLGASFAEDEGFLGWGVLVAAADCAAPQLRVGHVSYCA